MRKSVRSDHRVENRTVSVGGRPRKFQEPSQPITITLPLSTLNELSSIDRDRAKAIVRATKHMLGNVKPADCEVDIVRIERGYGLILVGNSRYLRKINTLHLVEVDPHRHLISLPAGTPASTIEIALRDLLEVIPASESRERRIISKLADIFRQARQANTMKKEEILIVPCP